MGGATSTGTPSGNTSGGSGSATGNTGPGTSSAPLSDSPGQSNSQSANPAILTPPVPNPGTEGGSGSSSTSRGSGGRGTSAQSGASGSNLKPGQPSAVNSRDRDEELQRQSERINSRIMRGICTGCEKGAR